MSSYWDYLKKDFLNPISSGPAALIHAAYDYAYDNSHGASKYYLSQIPILSWNRRIRDSAQEAQDYYDKTHTDPNYISQQPGTFNISNTVNGAVGSGVGIVKMARSLSQVYTPEIFENVQSASNNMYW